ncbi:rhombosortase [bacterium]|nr:rhombosortase [bacterium]
MIVNEVRGWRRIPCASIILSLIAVLFYLIPGSLKLFEYNKLAIGNGQIWRLITCHFTHFTTSHFFWDFLTFFFLAIFCELQGSKRFMFTTLVSVFLISISLWFIDPTLMYYRGLSGLCSALYILFALICLSNAKKNLGGQAIAYMFIFFFIVKTLYELSLTSTVFVSSLGVGVVPIPLSHLVGAIAGLIGYYFFSMKHRIIA